MRYMGPKQCQFQSAPASLRRENSQFERSYSGRNAFQSAPASLRRENTSSLIDT